MAIKYLPYKKIDKQKWDACIERADNRLIYARSVYLDTMAKNWDALVLNDYEAVMPLTWNKKYGFSYLYQPFFVANLGLFGQSVTADLLKEFLQQIPEKFSYWDIYLNYGNYFNIDGYQMYERVNYVLSLNRTYEAIADDYREQTKRNIKKAYKYNCYIKKDIPVEDVIGLAISQASKFSPIKLEDFERVKQLYYILRESEQAITYGGYSSYGSLVASAAFFFYQDRAYYILVGNHPDGRTLGVSHALIDAFIRDHAGKPLLLDFEGSDVQNIAFFYSSFGASQELYSGLRNNKLPLLLRRFKQ